MIFLQHKLILRTLFSFNKLFHVSHCGSEVIFFSCLEKNGEGAASGSEVIFLKILEKQWGILLTQKAKEVFPRFTRKHELN